MIIAGEEGCRAGNGCLGGAVLLVTAIHAVGLLVTLPVCGDALSVATGEGGRCTGIIYNENKLVTKMFVSMSEEFLAFEDPVLLFQREQYTK